MLACQPGYILRRTVSLEAFFSVPVRPRHGDLTPPQRQQAVTLNPSNRAALRKPKPLIIMPRKWGLAMFVLIAMLGVVPSPRDVHARKKPRRARPPRPQYENFTGAEQVTEVPLSNYEWSEVEQSMEQLLEAALGPEVAYWKARGVTCDDIAHTVRELHNIFLHGVRVVLVRNQTWHFLNPLAQPQHPGANGDGGGSEVRGASRFGWPPLAPNPPDTCSSPCQAQLKLAHEAIAARLAGWRSKRPREPPPPRYELPDMVFVINAADNMQRFGAGSRAPVLSLMKWWRVPGTAAQQQGAGAAGKAAAAASDSSSSTSAGGGVSLGRIDGRLLRPLGLPSGVARSKAAVAAAAAAAAAGGGRALAADAGAGAAAAAAAAGSPGDPLWDLVRRFVAERPPELPPGVEVEPRRRRQWRRGEGGDDDGDDGDEERPETHRKDYDMDLLLPTMTFAPRSLSYFPWERKKDVAFFRGIAFCPLYVDLHPICPRALLANVSAAGWFRSDLDVRLVRRFRGRLGSRGPYRQRVTIGGTLPTSPRDHSRYRYLLNMDGLAGSTRMGVLMATDSVVLKSRSPYIEYYSRLQVPGSHYLEFWKDPVDPLDVLGVLAEARAATAADPEGARAAAAANQAIAARYIAMEPKLVYARAALLAYHSLVPDMALCVGDLLEHLTRSGQPLPPPGPHPPAAAAAAADTR